MFDRSLFTRDFEIENISKEIACAIGAIKQIQHLTPFNVLIKVYCLISKRER